MLLRKIDLFFFLFGPFLRRLVRPIFFVKKEKNELIFLNKEDFNFLP